MQQLRQHYRSLEEEQKMMGTKSGYRNGSRGYLIGRGERIRTSDLSVPNHRCGKKLSFCHFESCSHHEFISVLRFVPVRYQRLTANCCEFCPQIGHKFFLNTPRLLLANSESLCLRMMDENAHAKNQIPVRTYSEHLLIEVRLITASQPCFLLPSGAVHSSKR